MTEINLDATNWKTTDDFYDGFFKAVGSPHWHGRNFNALRDSIAGGRINDIELPYTIRISGVDYAPATVKQIAHNFYDLIKELRAEGYAVDVTMDP